jgi:chemotaxis protein MotB
MATACGVTQELYNQRTLEYDRCQSTLGRSQNDLNNARKARDELTREQLEMREQMAKLSADRLKLLRDSKMSESQLEQLKRNQDQAERRGDVYRQLLQKLRGMIDSKTLAVEIRKGKMLVKLGDQVLFDPGKVELRGSGQTALRAVAAALREIPDRDFLVAGHTDNTPIRNSPFRSNWELSTARAVTVVRFLQSEGVDPRHLAAAGFSEFDALADNEAPVDRARNRRIEIVLMPRIEELPPIPQTAGEDAGQPAPPPDAGTIEAPILP